jgi:hypothetical protein
MELRAMASGEAGEGVKQVSRLAETETEKGILRSKAARPLGLRESNYT